MTNHCYMLMGVKLTAGSDVPEAWQFVYDEDGEKYKNGQSYRNSNSQCQGEVTLSSWGSSGSPCIVMNNNILYRT